MPSEGEDHELRPAARRRRWPRLLGAALLLVALAGAGLWLARRPIAAGYADRFLKRAGVPARYRIADLGFGRQRLVDVVLGDPAHPDLVADWLEARTSVGLNGARLVSVRGGHLRLRARMVGGRLSLGSLDGLFPASPKGTPFALPALTIAVEDARVRLETPYGVAGLKVVGSGRLDDGFKGKVAVASDRLRQGACATERVAAALDVRSTGDDGLGGHGVTLAGPARVGHVGCGGVTVSALRSAIKANWAVGRDQGSSVDARVLTGAVAHRFARASGTEATLTLIHGSGGAFTVSGDLAANRVVGGGASARRVRFEGALGNTGGVGTIAYTGDVAVSGANATALQPRLAGVARGTPVAPLIDRAAAALGIAARDFAAQASVTALAGGDATIVHVRAARARAASGARVDLTGGDGIEWRSSGQLRLDGNLQVAGGGLPTLSARVAQRRLGGARSIALTMAPYAAGDARLALTPVLLNEGAAGWSVRTVATLSGPLAGGRVDELTMPVDLVTTGRGVVLNRGCAPLGWARLAVSGLVLDRAALRLCPTGATLVSMADGTLKGGARVDATRLTGRLGDTPLTLAAAGARVDLATRGFALRNVAARLGQPGRLTRLDIPSLDGRVGANGLAGRFAGAGGQIGVVPLLLSNAAGEWRFAGGALSLAGALIVSDAQAERPRFRPMPVRDVTLTLRGNDVAAFGQVRTPDAARKVADVRLVHDLRAGTGGATFSVPGLLFDKTVQPDQLTPVTFGVIADVRGTVTGEGRVDWTPAGVTSGGRFRTTGTDLAAAFGPVEGIAGEIVFTDLLNLRSAPGQQLRVRSVNPGIAVTDGLVRFQTLPEARVQVEGARWPFAGGTLTLEPSLLDFSGTARRRMTFRVDGMAADQFLQQFDFKNLNATGIFDGVLPMVFDASGGRIEGGRLIVRPGGGQIAYVGPISQKNLGLWANIAFQALKSIRYRALTITMNGPLAGEMVTDVRFAGISQGAGAKSNFLIRRLQRLPFVFNIRMRAPFRGLLDATASFYDPKRLIQRNLPQLLQEQEKRAHPPAKATAPPAVQPPASETVP